MSKTGRYIIGAIILGVAGFIIWYFSSIIAYILIAAVLSLIGQPLVALLSKIKIGKFRIPRTLSAAITLALLLTLVFGFFRLFIPIIASQAEQVSQIDTELMMQNLDDPLGKMEDFMDRLNINGMSDKSMKEYAVEEILNVLSISDVSNIFSGLAGFLGNIFVALFAISFICFFFLKDEKLFANSVILLIPAQHEEAVRNAMLSIKQLLMRYFIGITIDVSIVITLITIGLSIIGLKLEQALIIALFVGIMNVIPYLGPIIGVTFGLLMGVVANINLDFYTGILPQLGLMLIVFLSVQITDAIFLQPVIYSSSVKAHPLEIFLLIMIAGSLAGITGIILAIPTYTVLRVIAKEFFNQFKVVKKLTENI